MKATITNHTAQCARNLHGDKELAATLAAIAPERPGAGAPLKVWAEARVYVSRSARWGGVVHCSLWVSGVRPTERAEQTAEGETRYQISGYGKAGGGGYHKASAALADAIRSAGIELDENIDGCGSQAMVDAMKAIARAAMGLDHPAYAPILVHTVGV